MDFNFEFLKEFPTTRTLEIIIRIEEPEDLDSARCAAKNAAKWVKRGEREGIPRQTNLLLDDFKCTFDDLNRGSGLNDGGILSRDDRFYIYEISEYSYEKGWVERNSLPFFDGFENRMLSMTYIATEDDAGVGVKDQNGNFNWLNRFSSLKKLNLIIEDLWWDVVKPIKLESDTIVILSIARDDRDVVLLKTPQLRELCIGGDRLYRVREDMEKLTNLQFIS
ncbi:unnamed protein product [Ambrosiozyma monospora]|uniref:Unnamed protein product n=1 Tax=Ambrosiozyma monospora TaxID=43982 RepID=A0ACB5SRA8_AMBMO|nr:unnamed protein product [Ambrosiozyma monospora]